MANATCELTTPLGEHDQDDEVLHRAVHGAFETDGSDGDTLGAILDFTARHLREQAERAELLARDPFLGSMSVDEVKAWGLEVAVEKPYASYGDLAYGVARRLLKEREPVTAAQ